MDYPKRTNVLWASSTELAAGHANQKTVHTFYHLFYVRYGEGIFLCDDIPFKVSKGMCILALPHVYHEVPAEKHNLMGFHEVKFEINDPSMELSLKKAPTVFSAEPFFDDFLTYICNNYSNEYDTTISRNVDCLLSAILTWSLLDPNCPSIRSSRYILSAPYNNTTQRTMNYIETQFDKKFRLNNLSAALDLNPNYLSDNFKKDTRCTIVNYLNYVRVMEVLQTIYFRRDTPLNEIAFQCGFGSVSSFNRIFKTFIGISPGEFKSLLTYNLVTNDVSMALHLHDLLHELLVVKRYSSISEALNTLQNFTSIIAKTQ